jgi:DNA-binding CsgD family transcriptional regulator
MTASAKYVLESSPGQDTGPQPGVVTFQFGEVRCAFLSVARQDEGALGALSPAEREVAVLAVAGLSNLAIARCRGKAVRTIANQMASVLSKLRVGSRHDLAERLALCPLRDER